MHAKDENTGRPSKDACLCAEFSPDCRQLESGLVLTSQYVPGSVLLYLRSNIISLLALTNPHYWPRLCYYSAVAQGLVGRGALHARPLGCRFGLDRFSLMDSSVKTRAYGIGICLRGISDILLFIIFVDLAS